MTAKKCTKKRDARAKIVVLLIKPIVFLKFSLPSLSSDLKVPTAYYLTTATPRPLKLSRRYTKSLSYLKVG